MSRVVIYSNWLTYHIVTNGLLPMCAYIHIYVVFRRKGPVWHGRSKKTVLYTYIRRKGPVWHGRSAKTVLYTYIRRKGPVLHGRSAKTVLYIILGGRDPYCTGGVRRRCYNIHIFTSLQMIENEWLCVIYICVCDTRGMLDVLSYMIMKTSEYRLAD